MKFSVVTTSFNSSRYIDEAVQSALLQREDVDAFEHIVADANSTDGTLQVLEQYPHLVVDSRPDLGIYDGMNRAISMATGDIVVILNSDDTLLPGALRNAQMAFEACDADVVSGGFEVISDLGGTAPKTFLSRTPPTYLSLLFGIPAINASFFRRDVFKRVGAFDLSLGLAADRAWLIRALNCGLHFENSGHLFYRYRQHSGSATLSGEQKKRRLIHQQHIEMANVLSFEFLENASLKASLRTFSALERMKLANTYIEWNEPGDRSFRDYVTLSAASLAHPLSLLSGLWEWWRYRGRYSSH